MAKTTQPTAEPEPPREPEELPRPPEHVQLYIAPGMNTVSFAELMMGFGVRRDLGDWMEGVTGQLANLTNEIAELSAHLEELRQAPAGATVTPRSRK